MKVVHVAIALVTIVSLNAQFAAAGPITLNYNYNGLYQGTGDTGYTSISDRGVILNGSTVYTGSFGGSTTTSTQGAQDFTSVSSGLAYHFVSTPNANDIVALRSSSPTIDTTTLASPMALTGGSTIGVLYNYSNNGGKFDMVLGFSNNTSVTVTLAADDWTNGVTGETPAATVPAPLPGVATQALVIQPGFGHGDGFVDGVGGTNSPFLQAPLEMVQATVTASSLLSGEGFDINGLTLTSITFDNLQPVGGGSVGIYAVSISTPEPSSIVALCGLGLAGLFLAARRRRKS
jgi:hypothetical protein